MKTFGKTVRVDKEDEARLGEQTRGGGSKVVPIGGGDGETANELEEQLAKSQMKTKAVERELGLLGRII